MLRYVFAIVLGLLLGSIANMFLITISSHIIPIPEGVDNTTTEGLKSSIHLFKPKHFIFPFLAHAIGTLIGAMVSTKIAKNNNIKPALIIGGLFFIGGTIMVYQLPSPLWFNIVDLTLAYFPMSILAYFLIKK